METKPFVARPPLDLVEDFRTIFNGEPDFIVRAPGRVDLIGTHTDYNNGWVLPAAIDRYAWLAVKKLPATLVTLHALDFPDGKVAFRLTELDDKCALDGQPLPTWAQYAAGVAWSLQEAGLATPGSRLALSSEIPIGAGLSSSAAVEVAYATAWAHITGWEVELMELAQLCQRAENRYVGVNSGLMDQFACLFGRAGHALLFDCWTQEWEAVPMSDRVTLVVADTGTRHALTNSPYNERRAECEQAVQALKSALPDIHALRDVSLEKLDAYQMLIPEPARRRARHVIEENARVRTAAQVLRRGEVAVLGELMDQSYISSRDLFDASGPELEAMWQAAHDHPACLGGRFIGAGWAGCMVFLVEGGGEDEFVDFLERRYQAYTGHQPAIYRMKTADGVQVLPGSGW